MQSGKLCLDKFEKALCRFPCVFTAAACFIFTLITHGEGFNYLPYWLCAVVLLVATLLMINNKLDKKRIVILIFILGFLLRLLYVLYTGINERQHDVEFFGNGIGHSGYIEYIYDNLSLPKSEVKNVWQFYHPPLHHIISAIYIKIQTVFGATYSEAIEGLGMLSLFYSSATLIMGYKIFKSISKKGEITAAMLLSFCPSFIIFSGSINNDPLSFLFMTSAIFYTIRWYNTRNLKDLIFAGLSVGLGMFTKASAVFAAVPVALIFLYVLIFDRREKAIGRYIGEFAVFGVVSVPIGVYWGLRNLIKYGVSLTYVPTLSIDNPQYIGYHSAIERLFNFSTDSPFNAFGRTYYEFNPTLGLIKTALFGEQINEVTYPEITVTGLLMFVFGILITVLIVAAAVWAIINARKDKNMFVINLALVIFAAVNLLLYYRFCFLYPFTCTENIRYCAAAEVAGLLFVAKLAGETNKKWLKITINTIVCIMAVLTAWTYTLIS